MTSQGEDTRLALLAARGDRDAYRKLLINMTPQLLASVRGSGVPEADVEDVTQEAAISIWKNLTEFDPTRPFAPWVAVIAVNKARDWLRRRRVRSFWLGAEQLTDRIVSDQASVEDTAADRIEVARVQAAIATLPRNLCIPIVLTSILGHSHAEAATALGVSPKAIELRVARARAKLKDILG